MNHPEPSPPRPLLLTDFRLGASIFLLALLVRCVFLYQHSHNPTFHEPIVDARQYHDLAAALSAGKGLDLGFFWQPPFYPFLLAGIYAVAGPAVVWPRIVQALIGATTCLLTWRLDCRIFDRRVGTTAGLFTALYGTLIFYDGELVAASWAAFWSVVLLSLLLRAAPTTSRNSSLATCFLVGLCCALAILTRPTFVPFCITAAVWLAITLIRRAGWRIAIGRLAAVVAGFFVAAAPVAVLHYRVAGYVSILPASGGLNLYLGNNPNLCETLTVRPGDDWDDLVAWPARRGCTTPGEQSRFFYRRVWDFAAADPLAFADGLGQKALRFAVGRELPRNIDIYLFCEWSGLLGAVVWKAGGFGFPWGVVFPLAVVGLIVRWRRLPAPVILFAVLYPCAVIFVFVAGRYRVPVVPVMCLLAAGGLWGIVGFFRNRRIAQGFAACTAAAVLMIVAGLPPPFCEERVNYGAEMYALLGDSAAMSRRPADAERRYRLALALDPQSVRLRAHLGVALAELGRFDEAAEQLGLVIERAADPRLRFTALFNRAHSRTRAGDLDAALRDYDAALALQPNSPEVYCRRGTVHEDRGELDLARRDWQRALELAPAGPTADYARGKLRMTDRE
jgi:4-amino-4-deoxy-L-arabinose transferase-like glycosyltransferase